MLKEIMAEKENKSIVFIETKRRVDEITRKMRRDGYVFHLRIFMYVKYLSLAPLIRPN